MCGLNLAWVSGLFTGGVGPNWAAASTPSWASRWIFVWAKLGLVYIVWMCGLNWVWVSGLFIGYGVGPNWALGKQAQLGPTLDTV